MNKETIKELRKRADEMISAGIANKDALFAALPVITELQAKADGAKKNLAAAVRALTARASTDPLRAESRPLTGGIVCHMVRVAIATWCASASPLPATRPSRTMWRR